MESPTLPLGPTFGALLLGTIIASIFYGITTLQTIYYFDHFGRDGLSLKSLVLTLWLLDTLTIILDAHGLYFYLITHYNDPAALGAYTRSLDLESITTGTIMMIVQMFFVFRIRTLCEGLRYGNAITGVLFAFFSLQAISVFATSLAITVFCFINKEWSKIAVLPAVTSLTIYNVVVATVLDVLLTSTLIYLLYMHRSGLKQTNSVINRLAIFFFTRGIFTVVMQAATLTTYLMMPSKFVWLTFQLSISKVYANSALAQLNNRHRERTLKGKGSTEGKESLAINLDRISFWVSSSDGVIEHRRGIEGAKVPHSLTGDCGVPV